MAKVAKKRRWLVCATSKCRRKAVTNGYCEKCLTANPSKAVQKVSELLAVRWGSLDLEMRNAIQGIALHQKDMTLAQQKYDLEQRQRQANIAALKARLESLRLRYEALTEQIAAEAGLVGKQITVDPDTGMVREIGRQQDEG